MEKFLVEDVFVTEGVPEFTYVNPPNYGEILIDIRRPGKPVIIEGQSGTGKTTAVKKIISEIYPEQQPTVLTPREPAHIPIINSISLESGRQTFIVDDFHRLDSDEKDRIANLAKVIAERDDRSNLPKLVIVGINKVGSDLIQLVPDLAKRIGIHRVQPGTDKEIGQVIEFGSERLNIIIQNHENIIRESRGDYWLTQQLCKTICVSNHIKETTDDLREVNWVVGDIIKRVISSLENNYDPPVKTFCRGRRFRPTNDPYYKLLKAVSEQDRSNVDLNELGNTRPEIRGSINNVKDHRLSVLIKDKRDCSRLFYYDDQTKNFALEDPALFFYLRHLDWEALRLRCGFRDIDKDYQFDIAISFAGENRDLAELISSQLSELDISVFYDRNYEDNYLGSPWSGHFKDIFLEKSRLVVALLDKHHKSKVWPTFERDCFIERVGSGEVIPIRLDDTKFPGIPDDLVSIYFIYDGDIVKNKDRIIDEVVLRIATKLDQL